MMKAAKSLPSAATTFASTRVKQSASGKSVMATRLPMLANLLIPPREL